MDLGVTNPNQMCWGPRKVKDVAVFMGLDYNLLQQTKAHHKMGYFNAQRHSRTVEVCVQLLTGHAVNKVQNRVASLPSTTNIPHKIGRQSGVRIETIQGR